MIKGLKVINYLNESLNIELGNPFETGMYIQNIEGLGLPSSSIETFKGVNYDPSDYKSTSIEPRNIILTIGITSDFNPEFTRQKLYKWFPHNFPIKMYIETDVIGIVQTIGYVETFDPDIFSEQETAPISIICPDPYFYTGGKVIVDSTYKESIFNFTNWWNANFFEYINIGSQLFPQYVTIQHVEKEISRYKKIDQNGEIPTAIIYPSSVYHPRGFELEIISNEYYFNKIILEHDNGKLIINSNDLDDLDQSLTLLDNAFANKSIIIHNDINDQNIYQKDLSTGELKSILDVCIINGDLPNIIPGNNIFIARIFGIGIAKDNVMYWDPNRMVVDDILNSVNYNMWNIPMQIIDGKTVKTDKIVIKLYDNVTKKYLGRMEITNESCMVETYEKNKLDNTFILKEEKEYNVISSDTGHESIGDTSGGNYVAVKASWTIPENVYIGIQVFDLNYKYWYWENKPTNIPKSNIFKIDEHIYAIDAKFCPSFGNYDMENLSMDERSRSLTVRISDLQITESEFFERLFSRLSITSLTNSLIGVKQYNQFATKSANYLKALKNENPVFTVESYQEFYYGKMILSYDDRYDAI